MELTSGATGKDQGPVTTKDYFRAIYLPDFPCPQSGNTGQMSRQLHAEEIHRPDKLFGLEGGAAPAPDHPRFTSTWPLCMRTPQFVGLSAFPLNCLSDTTYCHRNPEYINNQCSGGAPLRPPRPPIYVGGGSCPPRTFNNQ